MFKLFLSFVLAVLCNQVGEEAIGAPAAPVDNAASADNGDGSGEPGQAQPPAADPNTPPAPPKYGDFGDNPSPDDIYNAHVKVKTDFDNFRRKAALTESNLAATRKSINEVAQKLNARPTFDGQGRLLGFEPLEAKPGKQRTVRFNDEAMGKLSSFFNTPEAGKEFVGLVSNLIQDKAEEIAEQMLEQGFEPRFKQHYEKFHSERSRTVSIQRETMSKVEKLFPGALNIRLEDGKANPNFDENLSNRAKEILESTEEYQRAPNGLLLAVADAAAELGIRPQVTEPIKREAFQKGKESAKILGPVQPGHNKPGADGTFRRLSLEEFNKLSPDKKTEYQRKEVESRK